MCRMSVDGSAPSQELKVTCRGGRSDVGVAETGADLKRGRNEVGGVSNNYGGAGFQGCWFDSDFRRGERYWLWGG